MPYIDIDIWDVIEDMSTQEIQNLANDLYDDGYVPVQVKDLTEMTNAKSLNDDYLYTKWNELYNKLSDSEIEALLKIHKLISL